MAHKLVAIDKSNWEEAAKLRVREDQRGFVTENVWSIAESSFYPWTRPLAIYHDETMVGFLVYGRDPTDGNYWLYRFMIDQAFQGKGFGKAALKTFIDSLRANSDCSGITVAYQPDNVVAERLYVSAGFVKGPPAPWGEWTARIDF